MIYEPLSLQSNEIYANSAAFNMSYNLVEDDAN